MKEKLYTIPITEAFEKDSECAFCSLYKEIENKALEYTMGPSYMEPDVRIKTNRLGFCREHYNKMYKMKNRLGLSLMISSHYTEIMLKYESHYKNKFFSEKKSVFARKKVDSHTLLNDIENSCFICDKISADMDNFFNTFIYMWRSDKDFRKIVLNSKGFCLNHFDRIINQANKNLSQSEFEEFFDIIFKKQKSDLERVKSDLDWFVQKFDYRFMNEPWNNSKDALKRSIIKIASEDPEDSESIQNF